MFLRLSDFWARASPTSHFAIPRAIVRYSHLKFLTCVLAPRLGRENQLYPQTIASKVGDKTYFSMCARKENHLHFILYLLLSSTVEMDF